MSNNAATAQLAAEIRDRRVPHWLIQGQNGDARDIERYSAAAKLLNWTSTTGRIGNRQQYPYVVLWRPQ